MLSDKQIAVLATHSMRFTAKEALAYLSSKGYPMTRNVYFKTLQRIRDSAKERAYNLAKNFLEEHIQVIEELEYIKKMAYENYHRSTDPKEKTIILKTITESIIPYLVTYKESTEVVIAEVQQNIAKDNSGV